MPRPGPRRPLLAVKVAQEEIDALDALAETAGVTRSDVVRFAIALTLRGVDKRELVAALAEDGREGSVAEFTPDLRARLLTPAP